MRRLIIAFIAAAVVVAGVVLALPSAMSGYTVTVVLDSAANVVRGGTVAINGFEAGKVDDITVQDGKAKVSLALAGGQGPLHDGAVVTIEWKAVLGERWIAVTDGPKSNPVIPSGGMIRGSMPSPMEFDQVLAALDQPTRDHLVSLINTLNGTVGGSEQDLNRTLRTAGPAVQALGDVVRGLGADGPAISQLVTQLDTMVHTVATRDSDVTTIINELSRTTALTAQQKQALADALKKLPDTLRAATSTLGDVPGTVDKALPLLHAAKGATDRLPALARNLSPLLADLRPAVAQLKPTLAAASDLLDTTPALLDAAHAVLPGANSAVGSLLPALSFLRPYTPELAGWLANWGSLAASYDANGHYAHIYIQAGAGNLDANPGVVPPGYVSDPNPMPGSLVGQSWTDAFGSGMR
ncbi:MCE family protein [Amycolatopsis sp. K13G38]|uniref:MCE family protein n=1 Tax=Amycolatopsis acididurans TaxID=2724524 RepID=A0ABX1JE67_9PSEU|nr:MlaD family protein [Amycolatopsis acididurans]NKQ57739.1 MCE family protein [Amycolatopsis acididurans]